MHPDMLTPKFNVGDEVWFIDKTDNIGKAVKGTVVEADIGSYRVKCNNRDDCKGHYLSPFEMFDSPEKAYNREISSVESSIEINEESIKDAQVTIEKEKKVLAVLKERKEALGKEVWIVCSRKGRYIPVKGRLSDLVFSGPTFETEKEAWKAIAEDYKKEREDAMAKAGEGQWIVYGGPGLKPRMIFAEAVRVSSSGTGLEYNCSVCEEHPHFVGFGSSPSQFTVRAEANDELARRLVSWSQWIEAAERDTSNFFTATK